MSKQLVNIIEFSKLYNILFEIKDLFTFHINKYKNHSDFLRDFIFHSSQDFSFQF